MKHPKSKDVYEVVERFRSVQNVKGEVRMSSMQVYDLPLCGTVACHAGWYLVACYKNFPSSAIYREYGEGVALLADDLCFSSPMELREWADANPELWGNIYGDIMFCDSRAMDDKITVKKIADWWEKVGDRLRDLEEKNED